MQPSRKSFARRRAGFTLIDLVVTVLILGILAAMVGPRFAIALHNTRARSAAERIASDLSYARQMAISQSATVEVQFTPATERYLIPALPGLNHVDENYLVILNAAPYQATLESATLGGDASVIFNRFGIPDSGGVITVASGGIQQTVTLDPSTGRPAIP